MSKRICATPWCLVRFRLRVFLIVCVVLGIVAGLAGRWWEHRSLPLLTIDDAVGVCEGDELKFSLTLSEEPTAPVVVRYATISGTAAAGRDYFAILDAAIRFEPGERWKTIEVKTARDYEEGERDETVYIKLRRVVGAKVGKTRAVGTIINGPVPADIAVTRFYGAGTALKIEYSVSGDVFWPFKIAVAASYDGESFTQQIAMGDAESARGNHTLTIRPAFDDFQRDYYLMVFVDSNRDVVEVNEENNFFRFGGGAFLVHEPSSGKNVLHIHGTDGHDFTSDYMPTTCDEVHFRGHDGNDRFDLHAFLPGLRGWLFGRGGDDTLTGSTASDVIFGGPGDDTLRGGDGDDLLVGGDGSDKLYGEGGKDELFGGPEIDWLVDTPENSTFDGGPGRDLFNGSEQNPAVAPAFDTMRDHCRGVEEEHELQIDLKNSFPSFVKAFPEHAWHVDYKGDAISSCSVKGDVLHVQFNSDVPEVSLVRVRVTSSESSGENKPGPEHSDRGSFHVYSIAVTGFKIERKVGPGENDWIEEKGDLWFGDSLRWTAQYEPKDVPIQWDVRWISKPWEDLDHPHVEWEVFSDVAAGPTPIANCPAGTRAITPEFLFKRAAPQEANSTPTE